MVALRRCLGWLLTFACTAGALVGRLAAALFGQWQAPAWLRWLGQRLRGMLCWLADRPKVAALVLVLMALALVGGVHGWKWYRSLPKPLVVEVQLTAPEATDYDVERPAPNPLVIEFGEAVAPLEQIEKPFDVADSSKGIRLEPEIAGQWQWENDRRLVFTPKSDWSVAQAFTVEIAKTGALKADVKLAEYEPEFRSAAFTAKLVESQFYQDPTDPNLKKLVAHVHFSHPVNAEEVEKAIELNLGSGLQWQAAGDKPFSVTLDKQKVNAYIHSAPLAIPREDSTIELEMARSVRAAAGGNKLAEAIKAEVTVPGLYSLRFNEIGMTLVDNERYEPEQVLVFGSNVPVATEALQGKVQAWLLPEFHPDTATDKRREPEGWGLSRISRKVLDAAAPLPLTAVPGAEKHNQQHGFKFKAPVGRYIYVTIAKGVPGFGGYQSGQAVAGLFRVEPYPKAVKLLSQGALLSLSGERKIGFVARGLKGVRVEIGRVLPGQLQHLVESSSSFAKPDISPNIADTLTERLVENRTLPPQEPGKAVYDSVDMGAYLNGAAGNRRGLFLVRLSEFDPAHPKNESNEPVDNRLILLTDLGILAKKGTDGSTDVFIQSLATGLPVADARVEVIGRNGLAVLGVQTDASGHARLPVLKNYQREKEPLLILASRGEDFSFLPLTRAYERLLDMSRFDVGGIENAATPQQLNAFVFSDRGLIRPGETAHLGVIVRTANWQGQLAGLPLEAEITDPRGLPVYKQQIKLDPTGFDTLDFASSDTSVAGDYQLGVYLVKNGQRGEQIGTGSFAVRDFEPDRLKVNAVLGKRQTEGWLKPEEVTAQVSVLQLFGAPAAGRRVEGEMVLSPTIPAFKSWPGYHFTPMGRFDEPVREQLAAATTNDAGDASLALNLTRFARATYRLHLTARAFEAGSGRGVAAEAATLVSSAPYLVGVKPDGALDFVARGSKRAASWIAVGPDLKPQAVNDLKLALVERRFVSVLTKQSDGTYKYESRKKEVVRDEKPFSLAAAASNLPLRTDEPGDFALVIKNADGLELNRLEYTVAGDANLSRSLERNAELQITLNKKGYAAGETIELNIRAPYTGAGLITIERDKVYQHVWFKADTTSSVQKITVPEGLEGNGYVTVQYLRDPASSEVFMSPLSFGTVPFEVNRERRQLDIKLDAPGEIRPGQALALRVQSAQPSRMVLVAVDEGILQVARYKTPQPLDHFFQKKALDVQTTQILDLLLPEFSRLMQTAAPGGDAEGALGRHLNPFKRKRQPPVAYWSGMQDIGPQAKTLNWTVPDTFNGKLRVFAIGVTADRVGVREVGVLVKGDLILSPNVPPAVTPGDEFTVSVGVFNNMNQPAKVSLQSKLGPGLTLVKGPTVLEIGAQREQVAELTLKATEQLGDAALTFVASANGKQGRALDSISVRPASVYRTAVTLGSFSKSELAQPLTRQLYPELRKVELAVGASPLFWTSGLSQYLEGYPYGCTEQMVSKALPALLLTPEAERSSGKSLKTFQITLRALRERQNDDGGFGLWAANPVGSDMASLHALHYLLEARERGLPVPPEMLSSGQEWLSQFASGESRGLAGARDRARAIYLLTRMGEMTSGQLASLQQELDARYARRWQKDLTAAYMAASYKLLKQDALALKLLRGVPWAADGQTQDKDDIYYDPLLHDAGKLYLTSTHFPTELDKVGMDVLQRISQRVSTQQYQSLSAAYLLLGLSAYDTAQRRNGLMLTASETRAAGIVPLTLGTGALERSKLSPQATGFRLLKQGDGTAFFALAESGFDRKTPAGALKQGLEVTRDYLGLDGKELKSPKIGEEFLIRLRIRSTGKEGVDQVALVDLLPGGVEVVYRPPAQVNQSADGDTGEGMADGEGEGAARPAWEPPLGEAKQSNWAIDYLDAREDRVVLYGYAGPDAQTFTYRVRATHAGTFTAPAPFAEAMYKPQVQARGVSRSVQIVKP
ncbi:alpha-2-macroglobulin family protein [Chitinilyticum piscinae]|uniref:Alpha-2-macroglobulin family protein n=1 Tax=Chitinilyticum piscinae TaxID=2866724 RepID=A0A8J7K1D7_9NEIS|nr:alpha-2-macroglobulin [Chitinilyticum piscinae]MBE9609056.1 alpha-2-macroglobulin family protein [Chitinilyticum piscinae]